MGNRGTTRSWDEEEIEKWGFDAHLRLGRRMLRWHMREREEKKLLTVLRAMLTARQEQEET